MKIQWINNVFVCIYIFMGTGIDFLKVIQMGSLFSFLVNSKTKLHSYQAFVNIIE